MFDGITISTPLTETWLGWTMLGLLFLMGLADVFQPGMYMRAFESLPTTKERDSIFVAAGKDYRSRVIITGYGIILLGLLLRWFFYADNGFHFVSCAISIGCCAAAFALRKGMQKVVAFTFFDKHDLDTILRHYRYINDCMVVVLYPVLLLALYTAVPRIVILGILALLILVYFGLIIYKMLACLPITPSALFYIPLYLLTVEILPLVGMVYATKRLIF